MEFDIAGFCKETAGILRLIGWGITLIKVAIPVLIIVLGILDFGKAVVGSDEKDIKKAAGGLGRRVVAGLAIFFIPSIIMWLFGLITVYQSSSEGFVTCKTCILTPWKCTSNVDSAY